MFVHREELYSQKKQMAHIFILLKKWSFQINCFEDLESEIHNHTVCLSAYWDPFARLTSQMLSLFGIFERELSYPHQVPFRTSPCCLSSCPQCFWSSQPSLWIWICSALRTMSSLASDTMDWFVLVFVSAIVSEPCIPNLYLAWL